MLVLFRLGRRPAYAYRNFRLEEPPVFFTRGIVQANSKPKPLNFVPVCLELKRRREKKERKERELLAAQMAEAEKRAHSAEEEEEEEEVQDITGENAVRPVSQQNIGSAAAEIPIESVEAVVAATKVEAPKVMSVKRIVKKRMEVLRQNEAERRRIRESVQEEEQRIQQQIAERKKNFVLLNTRADSRSPERTREKADKDKVETALMLAEQRRLAQLEHRNEKIQALVLKQSGSIF